MELLAGVPVMLLAGLVVLQLLAAGYSLTLADGAAESGAMAVAAGQPAGPAVRAALPGWAADRVEVADDRGRLTVSLRPPALLDSLARALEVESSAWVRPPQGG